MDINKLLKLPRLYFNKGLPVYLIFFITSHCNARCKTCFYAHALNRRRKDEELTLEEIIKISRHFNYLWQLTLSGGEPFLRDDIAQICKTFTKQNDTQIITIPTHCFLPELIEARSRVLLGECRNTFFRLSLDLDGIAKDQDEITGVEGSFDRFLETYRRLTLLRGQYRNFNIDITTVVSHFNQDKLAQIIDYVRDNLRADNHFISLTRGEPRDPVAKDVSVAKYEEAVSNLFLSRKRKERRPLSHIFRSVQDLTRINNLRILKERKCVADCFAVKKLIVINEIGDVFGCELIWEKLGNLRESDYDIRRILQNDRTNEWYRQIRRNECFCTWECVNTLNIMYNPCMLWQFSKILARNVFNGAFCEK